MRIRIRSLELEIELRLALFGRCAALLQERFIYLMIAHVGVMLLRSEVAERFFCGNPSIDASDVIDHSGDGPGNDHIGNHAAEHGDFESGGAANDED